MNDNNNGCHLPVNTYVKRNILNNYYPSNNNFSVRISNIIKYYI